ncbi:MAG: EscU/YscU/HrcU family type III secretion system export apparatus switch protein, partial [Roseomonas sp.]|nr:EscU/YscU/HrcU family type III secretion system export apparatus switch protein [Roseomonas sp.]
MSGSSGGNEEGGQDKTEEATPRRIEKAREEGQIALSREVVGFVALGFALVGMTLGLPPLGAELMRGMRGVLENAHQLQVGMVGTEMMRLGLLAVLPVLALAVIGAIAGTMLQSRGLVSAKGLKPQFSRINPASGIKRLLGVEGGIEFLRTLIKLGVVCAALWWAIGDFSDLRTVLSLRPDDLMRLMVRSAMNLFIAAMIAFAGIAVLDYLVVRFRHLHKLRMTRQEVREEVKESEGDPMIKGRIKSIRMARARRRMMAAVPKAAVVITSRTHYAVELAYDENSQAAAKVV